MQNERVDRFNTIVGNPPKPSFDEVMQQVKNQCDYLIEEVNETKAAALRGDIVEVVDGVADVQYVAAYLVTLLKSLGIDQQGAFNAVCDNNDEKFTTSIDLAAAWQKQKDFPTYISEVLYDGITYYTVRKGENGKVTKYDDFPKVDLTTFIPKSLIG